MFPNANLIFEQLLIIVYDETLSQSNFIKNLVLASFLILFSSSAFSETYSCKYEGDAEQMFKRLESNKFIDSWEFKEFDILHDTEYLLALYKKDDLIDDFVAKIFSLNKETLNFISYHMYSNFDIELNFDNSTEHHMMIYPLIGKCEVSD